MIENMQAIALIKANKTICLFCPLGEDFYTAHILIEFLPNEYYMDYIDLDKFLVGLSGKSLTIEDACEKIYKELQRYNPHKARVTIDAASNTHLNVTVTKGDDI